MDLLNIKDNEMINDEDLTKIIRSHLCTHLNEPITAKLLDELIPKIIESIDYYFKNKPDK